MNSFLHVFHALDDNRQPRNLRTYPSVPQADESPASADTAHKSLSQGQKDVHHAGLGSVEAGIPRCTSCGAPMYASYASCTQCLTVQSTQYPVTCRARYYEAASRILEEEPGLFSHANTDELGHVIQKWIEETYDNWEPR